MTNLQHFLTTKLLQNQPPEIEQRNYYMTNLQHFLTTKLLHDQPSTFLNNKTTT